MQIPSAALDRFEEDNKDYEERARRKRISRLERRETGAGGLDVMLAPMSSADVDALGSPGLARESSAARECRLLEARLAELRRTQDLPPGAFYDAGPHVAQKTAEAKAAAKEAADRKRKELGAAAVAEGKSVDNGAGFTLGRKKFVVAAVEAKLTELGVDPKARCLPYLLAHGSGPGQALAECRDKRLHCAPGSDFHKPVPGFRSSELDIARPPPPEGGAGRGAARGASRGKRGGRHGGNRA